MKKLHYNIIKTLVYILLLIPFPIRAQEWNPLGILSVETEGNSATLKNDSAWRNCGCNYEMIIYQINDDTLGWYQKGIGLTNCDCIFNLSVTLDSLNPGDYFVKTSFEDSYSGDTIYIGLITFTILEQNTFNGYAKTAEYQSPCGIINSNTKSHQLNSISISPNPVNNILTIRASGLANHAILQICNTNGKKLIERDIFHTETQINIGKLPAGVYIVRLQNEKVALVGKMVKE
ncbi:MAG: T9SS type A sorting domain-containing protein [Bacteroidales bacterium]|nr:T9SS type A sorting domain-containing protein [Bacteroidales bacterium]